MTVSERITFSNGDKSPLSLDDLSKFVQSCMRAGAQGDEIISAGMTWKGKLQRVGLDVTPDAKASL